MSTSSEDEYEHFEVGVTIPHGSELSNLYQGSNSLKSPKKSLSSPSTSKGIKVLPATKQKQPKPSVGSNGQATGNYSLTKPPKVKSKTFKKKDEGPPKSLAVPNIGPKPTARKAISEVPPAPPKRQQSASSPDVEGIDEDIYEQMDATIVPGELTLTEFAKTFSHTLPQRIMVSKGVYGHDDETTLSTSDICDIHNVKQRNLVKMEEKGSKETYSVPVNSAIKFAPIFNHHDNMEEIAKGERFPYVSNLLDLVIMPKVVCACQPYDSNPVDVGEMKEILAIKEVIHPESTAQRRKLRVYSFSDRCDKILDESAYGDFSTRPSDIKLYMSDILKHVTSPFPMHLLMFKDSRLPKMLGLPQYLFSYPLLMTSKFTEVILIATSAHADPENPVPFEVPTEIDIDIQMMKLPESEHKLLVQRTENLREKLESMDIRIYKYENMSQEMFRAQTKFYQLVRVDGGREESTESERPSAGVKRSLTQRIEKLERASNKYVDNQAHLKSEHEANDQFRQFIKDKLAEQDKLITRQATQLKSAVMQITVLKNQLKELRRSVHGTIDGEEEELDKLVYDDPRPEDVQGESELAVQLTERSDSAERNKQKLAKLNNHEIIKLLHRFGLGEYETNFLRESVSGDLLVECDDGLLQNELGIKSKLHRLKLLRIIQGSVDVS